MDDNYKPELNPILEISDINKGYSGMYFKSGFLLVDNDCQLIQDHAHNLREALFSCTTKTQVQCAVAFARYLNFAGLNNDNYWLFLRLIMTNNKWVIDEIMHNRIARLLFSTIRPTIGLLDAAFEMLYSKHPEEIYIPAMESVLGIIQNAYFDADDGYRIRKLSIMDINALGKFLIKNESQEHPINKLILEILDRIARIGDYYGEQDKSVLSKHAFNVRYAYFDHARNLIDAIPEPLLIPLPDNLYINPENDNKTLVSKEKSLNMKENFAEMKNDTGNLISDDNISSVKNIDNNNIISDSQKLKNVPKKSNTEKKSVRSQESKKTVKRGKSRNDDTATDLNKKK